MEQSQLVSLLLVGVVVIGLVLYVKRSNKKTGSGGTGDVGGGSAPSTGAQDDIKPN